MNTTKSEQRQTIALLAGAMGVLALGLTVVATAVSARAYTPRQVVTNLLIAAGVALGFYVTLLLIHVLQNLEDARGSARARPIREVPRNAARHQVGRLITELVTRQAASGPLQVQSRLSRWGRHLEVVRRDSSSPRGTVSED